MADSVLTSGSISSVSVSRRRRTYLSCGTAQSAEYRLGWTGKGAREARERRSARSVAS